MNTIAAGIRSSITLSRHPAPGRSPVAGAPTPSPAPAACSKIEQRFRAHLQRLVAAASLGAFGVSNLAGIWLAALLIRPGLGELAGPLTYGRWAPVHLDLQLYGWCSLPAAGLLLARTLPPGGRAIAFARLALAAWIGALGAGAISWLAGGASGKLFLNWTGAAAWSFAGAQVFLWLVLAGGWMARGRLKTDRPRRRIGDGMLVLILAVVPVALLVAGRADINPPVNPHSGGATGHSLLASTLGIIGIAILVPALLGRRARESMFQPSLTIVGILAAHWVAWSALQHGNASNHDPEQIGGLATLVMWLPLLIWWYRRFEWDATHRRWLWSMGGWSVLLFLNGFILFLPRVLEAAKFTNALVAHSHLAMAGLLTSFNMLMLVSLAPGSRLAAVLANTRSWLAWNAGALAMVAVLTALGIQEGRDPLLVPDGGGLSQGFYFARLLCGVIMFAAALPWIAASFSRGVDAAPGRGDGHAG